MKPRQLRFTFTLASFLALALNLTVVGISQSEATYRFSRFSFSPYSELRTGYEIPPVQMLRMGGGKLGPNEKLKIGVFSLLNKTEKDVKAVGFKTFIFNRKDLNEALETLHSPLISIDVPAYAQRDCDILLLYADDIPLLAYKPGEEFGLEVAVSEVHYVDGSVWEAKELPGKLDLSKMGKKVRTP
jgi:hypothetical protein